MTPVTDESKEDMAEKWLMYIEDVEGYIALRITDWVVFDYVDDVLIEQNDMVDLLYLRNETINGVLVDTILFPLNTDLNELMETLNQLDFDEIQRIHELSD